MRGSERQLVRQAARQAGRCLRFQEAATQCSDPRPDQPPEWEAQTPEAPGAPLWLENVMRSDDIRLKRQVVCTGDEACIRSRP